MDAIILAAGLGTRLRPHTLTTPKPLLPVQERPILDWTLAALPGSIDRVIVVVNYLAEQIEAYLAIQTHFEKYAMVLQNEPQGTGDAVRCCREKIQSDHVLVLNGDDLYGADDLARLCKCDAGLLVHSVEEPSKFGIAFRREDGSLERLVEKPTDLEGPQMANVGAYLFPVTILDRELQMSSRGEYEITDYVSMLVKQQRVEMIETSFWFPIGTEEAWNAAQEMDLSERM